MTETAMHLEERFRGICERLGLRYGDGFYAVLRTCYEHPSRAYHNWRHIKAVLDRIDELEPVVTPPWDAVRAEAVKGPVDVDLVRFAAFYHDAVYVPGFALNEYLSAQIATTHFGLMGGAHAAGHKVFEWIMATRTHLPVNAGGKLLCDADLYELGTDRYWFNQVEVRHEFIAVEPEDWRAGRAKFLQTYLDHDPLFHLPGQESVASQASDNMIEELRTL